MQATRILKFAFNERYSSNFLPTVKLIKNQTHLDRESKFQWSQPGSLKHVISFTQDCCHDNYAIWLRYEFDDSPAGIYLFKSNSENAKTMYEVCSRL